MAVLPPNAEWRPWSGGTPPKKELTSSGMQSSPVLLASGPATWASGPTSVTSIPMAMVPTGMSRKLDTAFQSSGKLSRPQTKWNQFLPVIALPKKPSPDGWSPRSMSAISLRSIPFTKTKPALESGTLLSQIHLGSTTGFSSAPLRRRRGLAQPLRVRDFRLSWQELGEMNTAPPLEKHQGLRVHPTQDRHLTFDLHHPE